jgi:hypothetical protein
MDPVHIKKLSHITPGGSNSPTCTRAHQAPAAPPPRDQIRHLPPSAPSPPRRLFLFTSPPRPHRHTVASLLQRGAGGMKVTVVSRSGREVVKGGIDLKESVRSPAPAPAPASAPLPPPPLDLGRGTGFHPAGFLGEVLLTLWALRSRGKAWNFDWLLGPFVQAKVADLQEAIHARSKWIRLLAQISQLVRTCCSSCAPFVRCNVSF